MANVITRETEGSVNVEAKALVISIDATNNTALFVPCAFSPSSISGLALNTTVVTRVEWHKGMVDWFLQDSTVGGLVKFGAAPFTEVVQGNVRGLLLNASFLGTQADGVHLTFTR